LLPKILVQGNIVMESHCYYLTHPVPLSLRGKMKERANKKKEGLMPLFAGYSPLVRSFRLSQSEIEIDFEQG
jgi:hypothetical protein